jgi:transcriptional regulator of PTS gene
MAYAGMNQIRQKIANRSNLLRLLSDKGAMPRKDIARELRITPAAVTQICGELMEEGVLCEQGELYEEGKAGRKKILVNLDDHYAYILTICIEIDQTTIGVGTLRGECLKKRVIPTGSSDKAEELLRQIVVEAKLLIWELRLDEAKFLGAGITVPGLVDRARGRSITPSRIWDQAVSIREMMEKPLNMPVIVENNVKSYAEAEITFGTGKPVPNILFVKWGPGVGSAIVIRGEVYDSNRRGASELGHICVRKNGKPCRCGRRGCLETEVSTHAIVDSVREKFSKSSMPELWNFSAGDPSGIRVGNFLAWADLPDPALREVLDEKIRLMAKLSLGAATFLAPDQLIYYGDIFRSRYIASRFCEMYREADVFYEDGFLQESSLIRKNDFIGPLAVVYNEKFLGRQKLQTKA